MSAPTVERAQLTDPAPVSAGGRRVTRLRLDPGAAGVSVAPRRRRGLATVIGAFAICPCHLPLTLALLGTALGSTAAGAFLHAHIWLAGTLVTLAWAALTWRGLWLLRKGSSCPARGTPGSGARGRGGWRAGLRRGR